MQQKENKGITLIALIITIIVMLILVGVTVNIAMTGGLIEKTKEARFKEEVSQMKEAVDIERELLKVYARANGIDDKTTFTDEELNQIRSAVPQSLWDEYGEFIKLNENGKLYNIYSDDSIKYKWCEDIGIEGEETGIVGEDIDIHEFLADKIQQDEKINLTMSIMGPVLRVEPIVMSEDDAAKIIAEYFEVPDGVVNNLEDLAELAKSVYDEIEETDPNKIFIELMITGGAYEYETVTEMAVALTQNISLEKLIITYNGKSKDVTQEANWTNGAALYTIEKPGTYEVIAQLSNGIVRKKNNRS